MTAELELQDDVLSQFEQERASGIGATDTPKILGLSRRGTPLSVYRDKVGEADPWTPSLPAWLGQQMEATVAELYTARTGNRVRKAKQHYRHKSHDWMVCHLDYRVQGQPKRLVEVKTRAYMTGWGDEGTTKVPPDVWAQAQHEMAVVGADFCDVAVLFGHHTFRFYELPRDDEFLSAAIPKLEAFWFQNVVARVAPEPIGSDIDEAIVRKRHPVETMPMKSITPDQLPLVQQFLLARYNKRQAEAAEQAMKIRVIELIGEAEGITGAFGTITYRKPKDSTSVAWELVAEAYRSIINELLKDIREEIPDHESLGAVDCDAIQSLYTTTVSGSRRIDVRESKEEVSASQG